MRRHSSARSRARGHRLVIKGTISQGCLTSLDVSTVTFDASGVDTVSVATVTFVASGVDTISVTTDTFDASGVDTVSVVIATLVISSIDCNRSEEHTSEL